MILPYRSYRLAGIQTDLRLNPEFTVYMTFAQLHKDKFQFLNLHLNIISSLENYYLKIKRVNVSQVPDMRPVK